MQAPIQPQMAVKCSKTSTLASWLISLEVVAEDFTTQGARPVTGSLPVGIISVSLPWVPKVSRNAPDAFKYIISGLILYISPETAPYGQKFLSKPDLSASSHNISLPHSSRTSASSTSRPSGRPPCPQSFIVPEHWCISQHVRNHKEPYMRPSNIEVFQMTYSSISCRHCYVAQLYIAIILRYN